MLFSLQEEDPSLSAVRIKHFQKHRPRFLKLHFPPSLSLSLSLAVSHSVARLNTKQKACLSYLLFQTIHKKNTFFFFLSCNFTVSWLLFFSLLLSLRNPPQRYAILYYCVWVFCAVGDSFVVSIYVSMIGTLFGFGSYLKLGFCFFGVYVEFCVLKFGSCRSNCF